MSRRRDEQARTEQPTARRRQRARREGRVASSPLLVAAAAVAAAGGALVWLASDLSAGFGTALSAGLELGGGARPEDLGSIGLSMATRLAAPGLIVLVVIFVAALTATLVQVRPLFTLHPLRPDWSRLGLAAGWRQLFSPTARLARWRALVAAIGVLVPAVLIGANALSDLVRIPYADASRGALAVGVLLERWLVASVLALLALGLVDLLLQRRLLAAELRMSRRELEDERRETEGPSTTRDEQARRGASA